MKRIVTALVVAIGIATVLGGGVWAVKTLTTSPNPTAAGVVTNSQMEAVPRGGVSTGDGSTSN